MARRRRSRSPRIVPMVVMSAGFVSVMPTCALLGAVDCGGGGSDASDMNMCCDVAAEAFGWQQQDHFVGGDVAADAPSEADATPDGDGGDDATTDADDGGRE